MLEVAITAFKIALDPASYQTKKQDEEEAAKEAAEAEANSEEDAGQAVAEQAAQTEDNRATDSDSAGHTLGEAEAV